MQRTTVKELFATPDAFAEQQITVAGWVRSIRASNAFGFIELNDGSFFTNLQIVMEAENLENYKQITEQNVGAALIVEGTFVLTPDAKQPFEVRAVRIEVEGASAPDFPLQKKKHGFEFLRTIAHLRPRANTFNAVFRVRSVAAYAIHKFFQERGFVYVNTPIITTSDCEGAGEMFRITTMDLNDLPRTESGEVDFSQDFFGRGASLTVSGQLQAECYALAYSKVYNFGPTFRAERSNTPRHAAEFWMMEPEIAFADLSDDMRLAEDMIKFIVSYLLEQCPREIEFFDKFIDNTLLSRLHNLVESEFACVTYTKAIELLKAADVKFDFKPAWGADLATEHERYLTEKVFGKPVFVVDWPKEIKAFYMRVNDDDKTVAAMDLLVPGVGELIGGSQREERMEVLRDNMRRFDLSEEDYWWYMELRKYGGTRHAGFGLGFERLIMYVTGINNIRDVEAFPRTTGAAEF